MENVIAPEQKIIDMIKLHIEGMLSRQQQINMQMRELQAKVEMVMEEKAELESTLFRIENAIGES